MTPDPLFWQAEGETDFAYFVLEKHTQWLDELEWHLFRKTSDVVMGLDARGSSSCVVAGTLDDVGVERSLCQEGDRSLLFCQMCRFCLEDTDELFTNDPALLLRVNHIGEAREEALVGI